MRKEVRQSKILNYLSFHGDALVSELAEEIDVSQVTIRHDLKDLEVAHKIKRSHGGAVLIEEPSQELSGPAPFPQMPPISNLELKEAIAAEAVKLIADNDSIFIGGGSTFYVFSKLLKPFKNLKIVTTNVSVVYELAPYIDNIYFIGGELNEIDGIYYTGGPKIPQELKKIFVNKAFIGVSGINLKVGLTIYDLSQFDIYLSIPHIAQNVIMLCDYTKFDYQSAHIIGAVQDIADTIITNKMVNPIYPLEMKKLGINFITV